MHLLLDAEDVSLTQRELSEHSLGILIHDLAGESDQHADSHRVPDNAASLPTGTKLLNHLCDRHPVLFPHDVQQTERVVLHNVTRARHRLETGVAAAGQVR